MLVDFLRRLLNGFLALFYLIASRSVFAPHIKKNPKNAAKIVKWCDSGPSLALSVFKGGFLAENGIRSSEVAPIVGSLKEGDSLPHAKVIPLPAKDSDKQEVTTPVSLGEIIDEFARLPVILNFGSIT